MLNWIRIRKAGQVAAVCLLVSCEDATHPPGSALDLTGHWVLTTEFPDNATTKLCEFFDTLKVTRSDVLLEGTTVRIAPLCPALGFALSVRSGTFTIASGQVDGRRLSYAAGECDFRGEALAEPTEVLAGSVTCIPLNQGPAGQAAFPGVWVARRTTAAPVP